MACAWWGVGGPCPVALVDETCLCRLQGWGWCGGKRSESHTRTWALASEWSPWSWRKQDYER